MCIRDSITVYPIPEKPSITLSNDTLIATPGYTSYRWFLNGNLLGGSILNTWIATKEGNEVVKKHNLSSLRHLASVGEPLNAEAVIWSKEVFGLPFLDTYWQTETGSIVILSLIHI